MALTTDEIITQMLPDLAADATALAVYKEIAGYQVSADFFGDVYALALAYRAMHLYTIDQQRPDGEAGLITSKSEANVAVHYWNKVESGRYSDLQMTHWGQRLLALIHARGGSISVVSDPAGVVRAAADAYS